MNNKTVWAVLIVIVVVVLGIWYWSGMGTQTPSTGATTTPQAVTTNTGTGAGIPAVGQTVPAPVVGRTYSVQVTITGQVSQNNTDYPLVDYKVEGPLSGNGFFSLIGQNTNVVVWGKNQPIVGNYSIDPNQIDIPDNGPSHKLLPGDYFIRVQDSTGAIVGESKPFAIAVRTAGN